MQRAIGGGNSGSSTYIKIDKSVVSSYASKYGAGIGGGDEGSGGTIEITDSNIFACSGRGGAGIGGGDEKGCDSITIKRSYIIATTASEVNTAEKRFASDYGSEFDKIALYLANNPATTEQMASCAAGTLLAMLIDNLAEGTRTGAGIGSGHDGKAESILIEDSVVTATGGDCAAAIGGGISGGFGTIDIKNSKIHARSVTDGPGIGSGESGSCGTISITDNSIVVAEGGPYGAGIGGGDDSSGGTINITNSSVTAKGGTDGAGIGGGEGGNGGTITIKNSDVDARGGSYAAGIGGGDGGNGGTIKIDASKVTSNGGTDGAGIGGGEDGNGGHIEIINGSDVYAEGRDCGSGIGGGEDASGEYCLIGYGCNVHAVAGRGNAQAIGHGDCGWYVVKYTGGTIALSSSLKVRVNNVWFWGNDRFKAARKHNDVHLYTCEHTLVCRAENARTHGMRCTECGTKVGTTSEHRLNSEGVCIDCGAGKDSFIVKYIEKRSDGSEFEKSESMPSKAEFIVPECSSSPDGFGFKCWKDSNGRFWVPGQDYSQYTTDSITFTAQYLELTQTTYIDEEGREETVQARRLTPDKLDNNLFLDSGWYVIEGSATVTASADYVNRTICARDGVNLILADGCYLRINSSVNGEVGTNGNSADSLTLYGQREQTGGIYIQNGGMFLKNLFVYGGSLNINSYNYEEKLEVTGMLQIERGEINCSNSKINSLCYRGGHFTATDGLEVNECEPFRWESYGDDYLAFKIKGDYTGYSVADGYSFKDNQNDITYKGSFSSEDIERLRSETCRLRPAYMHEYDAVAWDWSEDYKEATVTLKCKDCSDVQQLKTKQVKVERGNRITVIDANLEYMGKNYNKVEEIPTEYKVTVHAGKGGNAAVDKETAQYFDTVTITPTPDDNYLIKTVTAKNSEGDELVVNNMRDGTYTFTIEDDDVDVYVEFIEGEYRPAEDPYFDKDGKYVPGCRAHYEAADGSCYEIKSDGTPDYSYVYQRDHFLKSDFKFVEQEDGTYRISKYTGTVSDNMTLVIPDTYQGKKVTVLGGGDPTAYGKYLFDSNNNSVKVVLNGNIRELKEGVFRYVTLSELSGDTSGLNKIAATAFPAWLTSSAKRDIYLDYKGEIEITGEESLNSFRSFKNSIIHLSHATTFKNVDETTIDSSTVFDFTDAHIYGEPEWIWAEDNSSAKAKFTCTDSRCRHEELIDAALTSAVGEDKIVRTASVGLDGKTYTDSKEIERKLYEIAIEECVHGTITADKAAAYEGEVITLTAEPAGGYSLSEISVKDEQGNDITVTESSFVMPAGNITVSAVFAERALNIHVGGVGITGENCSDILGDGTASYDFATNTLTLTDAEIEIAQRSGVRSGIRYNEVSDKPFNIVLNGNNKIVDKIDNGTSDIFGIALYAAAPGFTVSGGGTLDIELDPNQKGVGIHVRKALTLSNTTVTVNAANTGDLAAVDLCYSDTYLILTDGARMFIRSGNTALASNRSNIQNLHIADGCILEAVSDTQAFNGNIHLTDEHPDVRVNTAAASDGATLWNGSSPALTEYKYIRIENEPPVTEPSAEAEHVRDYTVDGYVASLWTITVTPGTYAVENLNAVMNGKTSDKDIKTSTVISDGPVFFAVAVEALEKDIRSISAVINGNETVIK